MPGHDGRVRMNTLFELRPYRPSDEDAAIALWLETWQQAYPSIDFVARVPWWRARWRGELVPNAAIMVAEQTGVLVGFVTIDAIGYLDQLVVAPAHWGSDIATALVDEAKRLSPEGITLLVNTGQYQSDPLLRAQWFRACRRGCESNLGPAGKADGMEGVDRCRWRRPHTRHTPRKRSIQYAAASRVNHRRLWNTGSPAFAGDDDLG